LQHLQEDEMEMGSKRGMEDEGNEVVDEENEVVHEENEVVTR